MHPTTTPTESSRRLRLKAATRDTHGALDARIMAFDPFASVGHYAGFLRMQYCLHRDVQALFDDAALNQLLPQLAQRSRLALAAQDLQDLGLELPDPQVASVFAAGGTADVATALGWLYTVEGSNIGAAFLLKRVAALGLDGQHGARHLAPHADGRAAHWRNFIEQIDEVSLSAADDARTCAGAEAAFARALGYVERYCPLQAPA